jgi:hypothetical protein
MEGSTTIVVSSGFWILSCNRRKGKKYYYNYLQRFPDPVPQAEKGEEALL